MTTATPLPPAIARLRAILEDICQTARIADQDGDEQVRQRLLAVPGLVSQARQILRAYDLQQRTETPP